MGIYILYVSLGFIVIEAKQAKVVYIAGLIIQMHVSHILHTFTLQLFVGWCIIQITHLFSSVEREVVQQFSLWCNQISSYWVPQCVDDIGIMSSPSINAPLIDAVIAGIVCLTAIVFSANQTCYTRRDRERQNCVADKINPPFIFWYLGQD